MDQLTGIAARGWAGGSPCLGTPSVEERTRVKICGCTTAAEVKAAVRAGADAVGLIFAPSPRRVTPEEGALATADLPPHVSVVGVFVDPSPTELERALRWLPRMLPQFSGSEEPRLCEHLGIPYLKVFPIAGRDRLDQGDLASALTKYPGSLPIFETASAQRGGSGRTFDWSLVRALVAQRRVVISGGLNPTNVATCVRQLRPYAVDVRSGVESHGVKDPAKLDDFINAVRTAHASA
ncbi:MAG TPA: phosphoribosylanthranilate isomerase [Candidatus Micrarchaeaceae archaeon]|nr:phosphoribosylanthranilate isomerase [Candidatus Micrarchaeaceae archaeon]